MKIFAPITDYIRKSLLTVQGDIIVRGASVPTRLELSGIKNMLAVNAAGDGLTYRYRGAWLFDDEDSSENAGIVTLTGAWVTITTIDLGTVAIGTRFFVSAIVKSTKSTNGLITVAIEKSSGTAVVAFNHNQATLFFGHYIPDTYDNGIALSGIMKVTTAGSLILKLNGTVSAGTAVVAAGEGDLYITQLRYA